MPSGAAERVASILFEELSLRTESWLVSCFVFSSSVSNDCISALEICTAPGLAGESNTESGPWTANEFESMAGVKIRESSFANCK